MKPYDQTPRRPGTEFEKVGAANWPHCETVGHPSSQSAQRPAAAVAAAALGAPMLLPAVPPTHLVAGLAATHGRAAVGIGLSGHHPAQLPTLFTILDLRAAHISGGPLQAGGGRQAGWAQSSRRPAGRATPPSTFEHAPWHRRTDPGTPSPLSPRTCTVMDVGHWLRKRWMPVHSLGFPVSTTGPATSSRGASRPPLTNTARMSTRRLMRRSGTRAAPLAKYLALSPSCVYLMGAVPSK